jgi:hypothetical protein
LATPARTGGWEAAGPRPLADLPESGLLQRVVTVDVHTEATEGFFGIPLEHVSTVPMLTEYVRPRVGADRAVVAPDMGWEPDIPVVASHGLFADPAEEDLRDAPVERYVAADRAFRCQRGWTSPW